MITHIYAMRYFVVRVAWSVHSVKVMRSLLIRELVSVVVGCVVLCGGARSALAYGPDCEATAELHYALAESLELDADAAWEDAVESCNAELSYEAALAIADALGCYGITYAPGGYAPVDCE